jgi:hypothetical protein
MMLSGTSGSYYSSLSDSSRELAISAIVQAMQKVFIPTYVGAALSLVLSCFFTVSSPLRNRISISDCQRRSVSCSTTLLPSRYSRMRLVDDSEKSPRPGLQETEPPVVRTRSSQSDVVMEQLK